MTTISFCEASPLVQLVLLLALNDIFNIKCFLLCLNIGHHHSQFTLESSYFMPLQAELYYRIPPSVCD